MPKLYTIITVDKQDAVKLTEGQFSGIIYQYGKVQFVVDEENDTLIIKFGYNVLDGSPADEVAFKEYIGPILHEMIEEGVLNNDIIYTGGV